MMTFWNRIDEHGVRKNVYGEMKESSLPLYIYGAGNLADNIWKKLDEYGIEVEGIITDSGQESWKHGRLQVYRYEDFVENRKEKSCNLLLGFASAYERKPLLENEPVFNEVFEIANPFEHHKHFDYDFIKEHRPQLEQVYDWLADEYSRECFCAFINARMWEDSNYVRKIFRGEIKEFHNDLISTDPEEVFLDIGAYNGGSISRFLSANKGKYGKIIGIEPEKRNFQKLESFCKQNHIDAELYQIGCWNKKDKLFFNGDDDKCCRIDEKGTDYIEVDAIDHIIARDSAISILNLGIATAEKEILEGAKQTIENNLPRMLIFMGSAKEELYTIPCCLKEMTCSYKIYLRFIQAMPSRLFLYALPEKDER